MSEWAVVAAIYGLVLAVAAVTQPISRRSVALAATLAYSLVALGAGTLVSAFWVQLLVPGALLLAGYWLSGLFFRDPQAWLEEWLLRIDGTMAADRWMTSLPRAVVELLELCYAAAYVVVGGGAIYVATFGLDEIAAYWSMVLTAELASYAALPWLRSRPPRVLEQNWRTEGTESVRTDGARHRKVAESATPNLMRRLNRSILDHASVQANTLPSGHVSGAVAAALAVMAVDPATGWGLMVLAGLIAVAAVAGRYHYAVDCVAGVAVASSVWSLM